MSLDLLDRHDPFAHNRHALATIAEMKEEWAGIPMPIEGQALVIEPTYPRAAELAKIGQPERTQEKSNSIKPRNTFWSCHKRSEVLIWNEGERISWGIIPGVHHFSHDLLTLGASVVWGFEQEARAIQLLGTLLRHRKFKQYMMTGMFIETSPRSGVSYVFRRLKPTIAVSHRGDAPHILAALCLHPIAYYAGSWAGAMCPTDDVIAHLMLMRGDESLFWRRANQHRAYRPEAGL